MTYKQAKELGGQVKKGEKATPIFFFKMAETDQLNDKGEPQKYPMLKQYSVFNLTQIEGIEDTFKPTVFKNKKKEEVEKFKNMPHLPKVIEEMFATASYNPESDEIKLPELKYCKSSDRHYKTCFHELVHSTGHESRLNRDLTGSYGSSKYAREELTAELEASILCAKFGFVNETIDNTTSYISHWIKAIEGDVTLVYKAASKAQKAVDFILQEEPINK